MRLLRLFFDELYAAVLGAAFFGAVVSNGFVAALSYGTEIERIYAFLLKSCNYCLGALLAERIVDGVAALVVGMALNFEAGGRVLLHIVCNLLDFLHGLRLEGCLSCLEQDVVGNELTGLGDGFFNS